MPPRYAYWTILIDDRPTAFRARDKAELMPTFNQLRRTNTDVVFKWFSRGRLWETPEEARLGGQLRHPGARFRKLPGKGRTLPGKGRTERRGRKDRGR